MDSPTINIARALNLTDTCSNHFAYCGWTDQTEDGVTAYYWLEEQEDDVDVFRTQSVRFESDDMFVKACVFLESNGCEPTGTGLEKALHHLYLDINSTFIAEYGFDGYENGEILRWFSVPGGPRRSLFSPFMEKAE